MIDFRKLLLVSIKYWWVYVISLLVCMVIAGVWYLRTPATYRVDASLMLRQVEGDQSNQNEMIRMMGGGVNKQAVDEIRVLTSRTLMEPIVEELGLTTSCEMRKRLKWVNKYPERPIDIRLMQPYKETVRIIVDVQQDEYIVNVSTGMFHRSSYRVTDVNMPIKTFVGDLQISVNGGLEEGSYRITIMPLIEAVAKYQKEINVSRINRESNIIEISTNSTCPKLAIDLINHLLDRYNMQTAIDKNLLANQTDQFLTNRLDVITAELNQSETELEDYKRVHHITNLDEIAETYRRTCEQYDLDIAAIDAQLRILDYTASEINKKDNNKQAFPFVDGNMPQTLVVLINEYNSSIARLNTLLRTVNDEHPLVKQETELIEQKRQNIQSNIVQNRQTLVLKRENIQHQKDAYQSRLESVPEQERIYREMKRTKTTKENQYVYLIERREENAMLMASAAIPAITVDRAQMNPKKLSPKLSMTGLMALILGVLLPLMYFFLQDYCRTLFAKNED